MTVSGRLVFQRTREFSTISLVVFRLSASRATAQPKPQSPDGAATLQASLAVIQQLVEAKRVELRGCRGSGSRTEIEQVSWRESRVR